MFGMHTFQFSSLLVSLLPDPAPHICADTPIRRDMGREALFHSVPPLTLPAVGPPSSPSWPQEAGPGTPYRYDISTRAFGVPF